MKINLKHLHITGDGYKFNQLLFIPDYVQKILSPFGSYIYVAFYSGVLTPHLCGIYQTNNIQSILKLLHIE